MDKYLKSNLEMWNDWAQLHAESEFYDVEGFKNGRCTLKSIELEELGDVSGRSLLHLQCHFGLDTLSWARRGAKATGADFSDKAIALARSLSQETGIKADFVCSDIYDLPDVLDSKFDIVYTSCGVLCWLPDLKKWAEVIAHFLKPGGSFYIYEGHPVMNMFDNSPGGAELEIALSYFHKAEPEGWEEIAGSYAGVRTYKPHTSYEWTHGMSDIINSLIGAGLGLKFLHEFPVCFFQATPFMKQDEDGYWRYEGDKVPVSFSLMATRT